MNIEEIADLLKTNLSEGFFFDIDEDSTPNSLIIQPEWLLKVCEVLLKDSQLYFDLLECITGIDNGAEANTMEIVYNFYSIPFDKRLMLKVVLEREELPKLPEIDSLTDLWKASNWMERETYDLLGIDFKNHPDLRRILLPNDWKGYPLRKDYKEEEYYRGIKVEY